MREGVGVVSYTGRRVGSDARAGCGGGAASVGELNFTLLPTQSPIPCSL